MRMVVALGFLSLFAAACASGDSAASPRPTDATTSTEAAPAEAPPEETTTVPVLPGEAAVARNQLGFAFPPAPDVPTGPPSEQLAGQLDELFAHLDAGIDLSLLNDVGSTDDARVAWLFADLLRFLARGDARDLAISGFEQVTGANLDDDPVAQRSQWQSMTDHLIAWDLPALPGYASWKAELFTVIEPRWEPFFTDDDAAIDWRFVSWGGVRIDDRPLGDPQPCRLGCIPALDDPAVTDAAGGDWYSDDGIVFGITLNGESRAYPRHMMEIHEMVNDTLGGRRLGIPYCTLCGSAQAYLTEMVPDGVATPILRTSGLLTRSNKVMFDLETYSVFDTFTGEALSGPLHDAGVVLPQVSVITSTWGEWKQAHPDTTIVAEDGGIGREYPLDPLRGRDDDGPIFPIGDVDERLPVQEPVLGVIADDGTPIAFPVALARAELDAGRSVELGDIVVVADGSGVRATRPDGSEAVGHQAFWFAWSQFHPETVVWGP